MVEIGKMTKQLGCRVPELINLVSKFSSPVSKFIADIIRIHVNNVCISLAALPATGNYS